MRRAMLLETVTFLLLIVALAGLGWQVHSNRDLAHKAKTLAAQGQQAHVALCVFKNDLAGRIDASYAYLDKHPEGILGIPAATIRNSLVNQQATLRSLKPLVCDPAPKKAAA